MRLMVDTCLSSHTHQDWGHGTGRSLRMEGLQRDRRILVGQNKSSAFSLSYYDD
jgi:hypothetical protein